VVFFLGELYLSLQSPVVSPTNEVASLIEPIQKREATASRFVAAIYLVASIIQPDQSLEARAPGIVTLHS
jgi:hypothetical protein